MAGLHQRATVLVTGATGFLGRHLLARLLGEGCVIHATNRAGAGPGGDRVRWSSADLRDPAAAAALVRAIRPTHLLHGAWMATPGRFWTDPENLDWLEAGIAMLRAFGEAGGRRFVGLGTCAEYDWTQPRFVEDETPIRPSTLYGQSKAAMAAAAEAVATRHGFSAAWIRVFLPYGPGDSPDRLIPLVVDGLRAGREVKLGDGAVARDFIYAPDIADLALRLLVGDEAGAFNAGVGRAVRIDEAVSYVADRLGAAPGRLTFGAARPGEPRRLVADMAKTRDRLGWSAPTSLEAGLDAVLAAVSNLPAASAAAY